MLRVAPPGASADSPVLPGLRATEAALQLGSGRIVLPDEEVQQPTTLFDRTWLDPVIDVVLHPKRRVRFRTVIQGPLQSLRTLGLSPFHAGKTAVDLALCPPDQLDNVLTELVPLLSQEGALFELVLTSLPLRCQRDWMWEELKGAVQTATVRAVEAIDYDSTAESSLSGRAGLEQLRELREAARDQVQAKLQETIRRLSKERFETLAEKIEVAESLSTVMEAWGLRAISPTTGRPALVRARETGNPQGFFYFEEGKEPPESLPSAPILDLDPGAEPPRALKYPTQLPPFKLTRWPVEE